MNLYFKYFPKELIGRLKHKNISSEVVPVMEIPDFEDNLSCLYSLISEFFLFVTREERGMDTYLNDFDYVIEIPVNPLTHWESKFPELDLQKFDWFKFWQRLDSKITENIRATLLKLLDDNNLITTRNYKNQVYMVSISPYPQFEGLRQVQQSIFNLLDDSGVSLYKFKQDAVIQSPIPTYFIEKGLVKVGYTVYTLSYTFGSEIILNQNYQISKLNYSSPNDLFFEYIYQHPKQKISREQLERVIGQLDRPISKLVYDIGFKSELKKLFFPKVSNNSVYFNNPVTQDDLLTLEFNKELLLEQVRGLKTIHSDTV